MHKQGIYKMQEYLPGVTYGFPTQWGAINLAPNHGKHLPPFQRMTLNPIKLHRQANAGQVIYYDTYIGVHTYISTYLHANMQPY